jgi:hypothetical protein
MIIGTDMSLAVCKEEGYLMAKFDARIKYDHLVDIEFIQYLPKYCREESHLTLDEAKQWTRMDTVMLWDEYQRAKNAIQSCCDYHVENIADIKTYYDALHLADAINGYGSIFD